MSNRTEYFAILSALCITEKDFSPKVLAEFALRIWDEANHVASFMLEDDEEDEK